MIGEFLTWCMTPCPLWARSSGLLAEQIAIHSRYQRHRVAWHPHLEMCQRIIEQSIPHIQQRKRVVVLGSGLLLDIPIEAVHATFEEVYLVDAVHPWQARLRCLRLPQVRFLHANLNPMKRMEQWMEEIGPADWVISSMVLSQLLLEISATEKEMAMLNHLECMRRIAPNRLLLTDTRMECRDEHGHMQEETDLIPSPIPWEKLNSWEWPVAPMGERDGKRSYVHHVSAYREL